MAGTSYLYDCVICAPNDPQDIAVARRLEDSLRSYKLPKVMRDPQSTYQGIAEDFSESTDGSSFDILDKSRKLVLICSPRTKASTAMEMRLSYMTWVGRRQDIIAVLVDDEPINSFPDAFIEKRIVQHTLPDGTVEEVTETLEPVASDLRATSPKEAKRLLAYETVRITAALIGVHPDILEQRRERRRRQRIRVMLITIGVASSVTAGIFLGFGLVAAHEGQIAEKQTAAGAEMVDRLFERLPEAFADMPDALFGVDGAILTSVENLFNQGSTNLANVDVNKALSVSDRDGPVEIIRKAAMWRRFGEHQQAVALYRQGIGTTGLDDETVDLFNDTVDRLLAYEPGMPGYAVYVFAGGDAHGVIPGSMIIGMEGKAFWAYDDFDTALDRMVPGSSIAVSALFTDASGKLVLEETVLPWEILVSLGTAAI